MMLYKKHESKSPQVSRTLRGILTDHNMDGFNWS